MDNMRFIDLSTQYEHIKEDVDRRIQRVLARSGKGYRQQLIILEPSTNSRVCTVSFLALMT